MFELISGHINTFFFVFVRIASILSVAPFFGSRSFPIPIKMGLALLMGVIITPLIGAGVEMPDTIIGLAVGIAQEAFIGIAIGFMVRLVFGAIETAGELTGIQMGYSVATIFDPQNANQISVMSQFYNLLGMLLFFSLNVHIIFIHAIRESFEIVRPYGFTVSGGVATGIFFMAAEMLKIAVKLAAPVTVALFLVNIAMGVLARTAPQLNVFVLGFSVTILIGLTILFSSIPYMFLIMGKAYTDVSHEIIGLLRAGAGY